MSQEHILAIDNGTQSIRALLFDLHGNLVARARAPLAPPHAPQPGWAEHPPQDFWETLCQACRQLWERTSIPRESVVGVALTTQRGTVINLDRHGEPLRPAIVWPDQRRTEGLPPVGGLWGLAFRLIGMSEAVAYFQAEAEINWIRANQPEVLAQTAKYLLLSGYLTYRLTGQFVDSIGSQVGYLPFDYRRLRWATRRDWKWQVVPVKREWLPDLAPPGEQLGVITPEAAAATGIPVGLPLIAAASDKACEVLGAGCLTPDVGCLSYGTTATINVTHQRYVEPTPFIPPYPSAIPGMHSIEIQIYRGFWMVSWFKQEFGHPELALARELGVEPEVLLEELVRQAPPGSRGLLLQPYWSPGVKVPGPEARGAIIGFNNEHTRAHVYRAILEGLAYALREGKERIERRSGTPITALRVAGGGSQSDAAMQLTADIFGLPTERPHVFEASGLGAAINVAVGLRLHPDFATAVAAMTRPARSFTPDPATREIYDRLYHHVYQRMYRRLKPLYEELRAITRDHNS